MVSIADSPDDSLLDKDNRLNLLFSLLYKDTKEGLDFSELNTQLDPLLVQLQQLYDFETHSQHIYYSPIDIDNPINSLHAYNLNDDHCDYHFIFYVDDRNELTDHSLTIPNFGSLTILDRSADHLPLHFIRRQLMHHLGFDVVDRSPKQFEIDALLIKKIGILNNDTSTTLNLLQHIPEISLSHLRQTSNSSLSLTLRHKHAQKANNYANAEYHNPKKLPQLYFPDEHKYAIYLPLFGPIMIPITLSIVKQVKKLKSL